MSILQYLCFEDLEQHKATAASLSEPITLEVHGVPRGTDKVDIFELLKCVPIATVRFSLSLYITDKNLDIAFFRRFLAATGRPITVNVKIGRMHGQDMNTEMLALISELGSLLRSSGVSLFIERSCSCDTVAM